MNKIQFYRYFACINQYITYILEGLIRYINYIPVCHFKTLMNNDYKSLLAIISVLSIFKFMHIKISSAKIIPSRFNITRNVFNSAMRWTLTEFVLSGFQVRYILIDGLFIFWMLESIEPGQFFKEKVSIIKNEHWMN